MATRLKKLTRSTLLKAIAFILILICAFGFVLSFYSMEDIKYFESIMQEDFMKSEELGYLYYEPVFKIDNIISEYYSESSVDAYKKELAKEGIYFYATDGTEVCRNTNNYNRQFFLEQPSYILIEDGEIYLYPENNNFTSYIKFNLNSFFNFNGISEYINQSYNSKLYISLSDEYLNPIIDEWNYNRSLLIEYIIIMAILVVVSIISFIYLVVTTGKKGSDDTVYLNTFDKLYTDINLIMVGITIFLGSAGCYGLLFNSYDSSMIKYIIASICTAIVAFVLIFVLSLIRHIKNRTLIKHSFIYTVINRVYKIFTSVFASGPMMLKAMIMVVGFGLACMIGTLLFPLGLLFIAVAMYFVFINVNRFKQIKYCVKSIKEGDLACKTSINGKGEFARLSKDINDIADGIEKAVNNEVKSERMKSELISNVSHDIKTPLTSIINYVDLLKKEGMDSENATKYLDVLEQKSQRLKILTEDLFEAAKASSGDMPVNLEKVDIFSLVQQGLAELEDKIEVSELDFKVNAPKDKIYVTADGRLLWRVVENLLSNVFKYALKGSRVYIDIIDAKDAEGNVTLTVKNISSYELNIDVEELMERFKRADESRTSEGSGLGLAIAKNLMEIQKGSLNLEIDGDLFKAIVTIPKLTVEEQLSNNEVTIE